MSKSEYVLLNYDQLNEKGLKPLTKAIAKYGYDIAKVVPAGKSRKKDGIDTKTFSLIGMDEQVMDIQVNNTGDISGVRVNGKVAPYQPTPKMNDAAQQLAGLFKRGATSFQKSLARKMARAAKKSLSDGAKTPRGVKSNAQQLTDAKNRRDSLKEDIQKARERLADIVQNTNSVKRETETVKLTQTTETAQTKQLNQDIAQLEDVA